MPINSSIAGNYAFGKNAIIDPNSGLTDRYFNYVSLLLHMDGVNGSTSFVDNSPRTKTVTPAGSTQISTVQSKYGGASGFFNNTNSYLTTPDNVDFNFSTGDWTLELFCNISPVEADILINKAAGLGFYPVQLRVFNSKFGVKGYNNAQFPALVYELGEDKGPIVTPGQWYHVVAARQNTNFYLYVDGILIDYSTSNANLYYSNSPLSIGGTSDGLGLVSGYIDEVRITKGICRYPNGTRFIPPRKAFPDS